MRLNFDQCKHVASVVDKLGIAYFAAVGYTSYTQENWLLLVHAVLGFCAIQAVAVLMLTHKENDHVH